MTQKRHDSEMRWRTMIPNDTASTDATTEALIRELLAGPDALEFLHSYTQSAMSRLLAAAQAVVYATTDSDREFAILRLGVVVEQETALASETTTGQEGER